MKALKGFPHARTTPQRMACGILSPQDIPPESNPASDPQSEHVVGQSVMGPTAESVAVSLASDPFLTARHTGSDSGSSVTSDFSFVYFSFLLSSFN